MRGTFEWEPAAFRHEGRCSICEAWTRGGVRRVGYVRFTHLCLACARERFTGELHGLPADSKGDGS